jgi:hypothetical protein
MNEIKAIVTALLTVMGIMITGKVLGSSADIIIISILGMCLFYLVMIHNKLDK